MTRRLKESRAGTSRRCACHLRRSHFRAFGLSYRGTGRRAFGPDAYRFVRLLRASLADVPSGGPLRLVDIGSSAGLAELPRLGCSASTLALCLATPTALRSRSAQSTRSQTYASADRLAAIGLTATKGG